MLLRRIARPLLAGIFIAGGVNALRDPKSHADLVGPTVEPAMHRVYGVLPVERPPSTLTLVKVDAGVKISAGVLLALGKAPRFAAGALAATLAPTTVFGHRFWEIDDPDRRANEQAHFLKNLGLLGGLLLASADTEGRPSLAWRARRASRTSAEVAELFHRDVSAGVGELTDRASTRLAELTERAEKLRVESEQLGGAAAKRLGGTAAGLGASAQTLTGKAEKLRAESERLGGSAAKRLGSTATALTEKAEKLSGKADKLGARAEKLGSRASARAGRAARRAGRQTRGTRRAAAKRLRAGIG